MHVRVGRCRALEERWGVQCPCPCPCLWCLHPQLSWLPLLTLGSAYLTQSVHHHGR